MTPPPTDPPGVQAAREALADFDAPRCGAYIESNMHDEDGPIPGCDCDRHAGHDGACYGAPDEAQWAHLRATLAHIDTLTARLAVVEGERDAAAATERAAIVAFLRDGIVKMAAEHYGNELQARSLRTLAQLYAVAADAIESNAHHEAPK